MWTEIAGAQAGFAPVVDFAISPRSRMCPPGWIGVVVIDGAAIATAPDHETAARAQRGLDGVPAVSASDVTVLNAVLPIAEMLGPATLAYLDPADFRPWHGAATARSLDLHEPAVTRFLSSADPADLEESDMPGITSPAFAISEHGQIVAAAGYRDWLRAAAHLSVLTVGHARGRGLAKAAASAAVSHAIEAGKLPQWRARPEASRRVALALGFRELGSQVSIRLAPVQPGP